MRLPDGERLLVVVVVEDDGMAAMMSMMVSGDTPRLVAVVQPMENSDAAAIAPIRGSGGGIMPSAEAGSAPQVNGMPTRCRVTA